MKLLDCTLRDGGYVNNWEFSIKVYDAIIEGLQKANVDFIEVGLIGKNSSACFSTKFNTFADIPDVRRLSKSKAIFTVMFTYGEAKGIEIPARNEKGVDAIRLAYFKPELKESLALAKELKAKGYIVFLQAMATFMYSDAELIDMIEKVNVLRPYYFCMVDSFGVMYDDDIKKMYHLINDALLPEIGLGLHAHNNQQMALSNAITFIHEAQKDNREVCIDASIYGMGRGAGNVNMELLMNYLNKKQQTDYASEYILELWHDWLSEIYNENFWGYTWEYFLSAMKETNSAYIWYIKHRGIKAMNDIRRILVAIPTSKRYTLCRDVVDPLINTLLQEGHNVK